jgi:uncharacterized membrane protein HdeD (DUF308 family)
MIRVLARNWWALALRGLFAVLFGIATFVWPGMALTFLIALFAIYAILDGIFSLMAGVWAAEAHMRWWPFVLSGLASLLTGILAIAWPGVTALVLLYFIAAWAILTGAFTIAAAVRMRKEIDNEWLLIITGALSVIFGLLLYASPGSGILTLLWILGAFALVIGALQLALAFRLRSLAGPAPA